MTYNIELADKPGKPGLHHVMIRLHRKDHKPARIQLTIELEKKYWNPEKPHGKWVRSSHLTAKTINVAIESELRKVKDTVEGYLITEPNLSPKDCKLRYEMGGSATPFKSFADQSVNRQTVTNRTVVKDSYALKIFFDAVGETITLEQITPRLLQTYQQGLLAKGLAPASINGYMSSLRTVFDEVQKSRGVSRREMKVSSPFLEIEKFSAKSAPKGRLREQGLSKLKDGAYTFYKTTAKRSGSKAKFIWPDWARWCWLASFYQAGMRIGDLMRSRYEWYELDSEGYPVRLRYRMQKNGRSISVKLTGEAIAHLKLIWKAGSKPETYVLPFLDNKASYAAYRTYEQIRVMPMAVFELLEARINSRTAQLNRAIKSVASEVGAEVIGGKLTNHSARHSVGDAVVRAMKAGKSITVFDFQALFGHSSVQTSEIYRGELDESSLDSAVEAVFGE